MAVEDEEVRITLRLPGRSIRDQLAAAAEKTGRSMNAEIVKRLEESLELESALTGRDAAERDWGESPREMFARQEQERNADREMMTRTIRTLNRVGHVLVETVAEHNPTKAKLLGSFLAKGEKNISEGD